MEQPPGNCGFRSGGTQRRQLALAATVFTAIALYGSFVPLQFRRLSIDDALTQFRQIPFLTLTVESRADWVANVLLFVPLGYFWLGSLSFERSRGAAIGWALLLVPALAGLSVAIEFTQLWFPARTVSQNDIVAESIGGLLGAVIWIAGGNRLTRWIGEYFAARLPAGQIVWLLQAYWAGFILYSILPLDLTISLAELGRKYREGRISLVPFADQSGSIWTLATRIGQDILLTVPIGALAGSVWRRATDGGWSMVKATLAGTALIAMIELAQVFVFTRTASSTDVLLGGFGVAIGVGLSHYFALQRGTETGPASCSGPVSQIRPYLPIIYLAYAALILVFAWLPFDFIRDPAVVRERFTAFLYRVPGESLYAGSDFNAMDQIFKRFVIYAPLGYLVGLWSVRPGFSVAKQRFALGIGLACMAVVSLVGEIGQVFLVSRVADMTEILLCLGSASVGANVSLRLTAAKGRITGVPDHGGC